MVQMESKTIAPSATPTHMFHHPNKKKRDRGKRTLSDGRMSGTRSLSLSTTEDKRNWKKEHERQEEMLGRGSFSTECYVSMLIVSFLMFIGLLSFTIYAFQQEPQNNNEYHESVPYALQTDRRRLVIMSENLECSLLIRRTKEEKLTDFYPRIPLLMMCLHMTEPHSIAPDSMISTMIQATNNNDEMMWAANIEENGRGECAPGNERNAKCSLLTVRNFINAFVQLEGEFRESDYFPQILIEGPLSYVLFYPFYFHHLLKSIDVGPNENNDVYLTEGYKRRLKMDDRMLQFQKQKAPSYYVSKLFEKLARNRTLPPHIKEIAGKSEVERYDKLQMTTNVTRNVIDQFANQKRGHKHAEDETIRVPLANNRTSLHIRDRTFIIVPKEPTLSIVSAFIVKVVHDVMLWKNLKDERENEETMYSLMAVSHKLAIDLLPESFEWLGHGKKKSLLDKAEMVIEKFKTAEAKDFVGIAKKIWKDRRVRRKKWDRISSFLLWHADIDHYLQMVSMGLPKVFGSAHYGKERGRPSPFTSGGHKSQPFMSSAGIFILNSQQMDTDEDIVTHAVTSSGRVRTVDAVVIPVLRMLLLHEEPGKAVYAPAVFYDPRSGKFFCEHEKTVDHPEFAEHAKRIEAAVRRNGIRCERTREEDFRLTDRTAMAVHRGILSTDSFIAAIDPRQLDENNYPAGF